MLKHHWIKWAKFALLGLLIAGAAFWALLFKISDGHITDYVRWRVMVTFKVPIERVDDYRVVIAKAEHQLEVIHNDTLVAVYPIAITQHGLEPRKTWDDLLTPEGEFLIASMQYQSIFGPRQMLLETTEPSLRDYVEQYGEAGTARIADWEAQHGPLDTIWEVYDFNEEFVDYPIWNDILIHGGGAEPDWTIGCIALDDDDVIALFALLYQSENRGLGVVVEILP